MKTALALTILLATLAPEPARADQNDPRLDDMFSRLKSATSPLEAAPVEAAIWQIWIEHNNPRFASLMRTGIAQMNANALQAALGTFNQLVALAPDFAEAWNKRATIHYLLGNQAESDADITRTLQLEPFHFGALSGRGLVMLAQGKYLEARNAFNGALEVHPNMPSVESNLRMIDQLLRNSVI